jgi:hypothetical protein
VADLGPAEHGDAPRGAGAQQVRDPLGDLRRVDRLQRQFPGHRKDRPDPEAGEPRGDVTVQRRRRLQRPVALRGGGLEHRLDGGDRARDHDDEVRSGHGRGPGHTAGVAQFDVGGPVEAADHVDHGPGVVEQRPQVGSGRERPRDGPRVVPTGQEPVDQTAPQRALGRRHHHLHEAHGATPQL